MADSSIEIQGKRILAHDNGNGTHSPAVTADTGIDDDPIEFQGLRLLLHPAGTAIIDGVSTVVYSIVVSGATGGGSSVLTTGRDTLAYADPLVMNMNNGSSKKITLTGDVTVSSVTNAADTQILILEICQDGTGGHTFAFPSNFRGAGTVDGTASTCSMQQFQYDSVAGLWYATGPMLTAM